MWLDKPVSQVTASGIRSQEFSITLCPLGEEPACVSTEKLHSPKTPPEENGKSLLYTLYLEKVGKAQPKSELT